MAGVAARGLAIALLTACAITAPAPTSAPAAPATVAPVQPLVRLTSARKVFSLLRGNGAPIRTIAAWRPITGQETVLPVIDRGMRGGVAWLRVMLPGRPNGAKGWIAQRGTVPTTTTWHVVVRTAGRSVLVYRHGRRVRTFSAIVGKPSTPTPQGSFFVEETVRMLPGSAGTPFALATSARSNVLQEFEGGPGQIAIHGTGNLAGAIGTAASHGCVRLGDRAIRWMAAHIAPGTPVTIRP